MNEQMSEQTDTVFLAISKYFADKKSLKEDIAKYIYDVFI